MGMGGTTEETEDVGSTVRRAGRTNTRRILIAVKAKISKCLQLMVSLHWQSHELPAGCQSMLLPKL